jgi:alpha-tubulin suppressor-like RCC1 family protein
LTVLGTSTTLNTDVYTTERLEISNTNPTSTAFEVNQIDTATKILSAFTTGTSKNEIFTISTNGKVGINKTTPEYNLDITGDVRITGDLYKGAEKIKGSNWTSNTDGILSYYNVAIGKELVASSPHKLDVGGNINFSGDLYKNINNNNYAIETVRSELYFKDKSITTTSNLIAEPYLESGERMYPPSRLFTTNNLTLTNEYFASIQCGDKHTVFLTNDGKVYSCGRNDYGQLGLGDTTNRSVPTLISTNIGTLNISAIACGNYNTFFLTNNGKVYSCGGNSGGSLGLGITGATITVPTLISTNIGTLTISAISSGAAHTVFLTNNGNVYSCGGNSNGDLGLGDTTPRSTPQLITALNSLTISAIACGTAHTVFLTNDGKVYSCGANASGQLSLGDKTNRNTPQLISALNSLTISAIACGSYYNVFLTNDGKVYSCGDNIYGQLGLGNITQQITPQPITGLNSFIISRIACGYAHTLFLTNDGKVYFCGWNYFGQLGLGNSGTGTDQTTPQLISTLNSLTISVIRCGHYHTLIITNEGEVYSCGFNSDGQLALGNTIDKTTLTIIPSIFPLYTIYGSGLYTVSYSSFTSSFEPFRCFNEDSTANNQGTWRSGDYLSTGLFDSTTYSTSNLVSGYNGDWLVIKLPLSIKLKRFVIKQISSALTSAPRNFRLYGSTNGTSWTLLIDKQNASYTSLLYTHTDMSQYASDANKYYNHFGLVVSALVGTATTLSFDEFFIYGSQSLTYTPITNSNTKTLTFTSSSEPSLNSYNITFQVPTMTDFNNNSNIILYGDYDINLTSTGSQIIPKTGKNIPLEATSNFSPTLSLRYHLLNPIAIGAQWTYNSSNADVYYLGNVGIGRTDPEYNLDITGDVRITGDLYKGAEKIKGSNWTSNINGILSYSNVAIGKELVASSPHKLDVGGNINFSGDLYKNNLIFKASNWTSNIDGILSYSNVAIGKELVASSPHKLDVGGNIKFSGDLYKNINNNNYAIETVRSELYFKDKSITTTSNLIAEPYLESGERMYPPSRLFTTNNLTLTESFVSIKAVGEHTLFITKTGEVFSCGNNDEGQLGLGDRTNRTTLQLISSLNSLTISAVEGGRQHTVFITNEGKVYSCGYNYSGQLGLGNTIRQTTPQLISTNIGTLTISAIVCGYAHTVFLTNDGKVYSCGYNGQGRLGLGDTSDRSVPTLITALNSLTISAIACGSAHTVFLTNDGKVYSCGYNFYGELGLGNKTEQTTPQLITALNSLTISAIACGREHTVFITNEGKVYSCGDNDYGQLGLGNTSQQTTPQPITALNLLTISAIECGIVHTVFLTNDGKVYSCGYNLYGQLGLGNKTQQTTPQLITALDSLTISAIACGSAHTVFITNNNKVYACGYNFYGQLGLGNTTESYTTPFIMPYSTSSTIYGSGLYTISYSSFTTSFEPFKCFNEDSTANNQGTWRSGDYLSTGLFDSTTYSTSNLVSGYNGDWLVIKLPLSIKLKKFVIKQISSDLISAPRNFRLYGSTNGTSWTLLIDKQNASYTSLLYTHTDMSQYASDANKYYNHFGLVVSALVGSATTLSFDELFIYGKESVITTSITNNDTKTLSISSTSSTSYNITFPVPTMTDFNNNSNIILQGEYDINLTSTGSQIIPKTGKNIPLEATSNFSPSLSLRYHLLNPIKINEGAQWIYNSYNTNVYYLGNVGIGRTDPEYNLDITGDVRITGDLYKGAEKIKGSNWTSNINGILSYSNVAIGKELVASSPHKLDVGGNINFSGDLYKNNLIFKASNWTSNIDGILSYSNVAIGKELVASSPHKLDVGGSINISSGSKYKINGANLSFSDLEGSLPTGSSQWITSNNNIYYNVGNVGINIINPIEKLDVNGNIRSSGSITSFSSFSDERLKDREGNIENPIDIVDKLQGFYYRPNKTANNLGIQGNKRELGISAQDVQKILPELVNIAPADMAYDEEKNIISKTGSNYLTVNYEKMIPLLIESIKELNKNINDLKKENIELRNLIKSQ